MEIIVQGCLLPSCSEPDRVLTDPASGPSTLVECCRERCLELGRLTLRLGSVGGFGAMVLSTSTGLSIFGFYMQNNNDWSTELLHK